MAERWLHSYGDTSSTDYSEVLAMQQALFETCQEQLQDVQHHEDENYARSLQEKYDAEFAAAVQSTFSNNDSSYENRRTYNDLSSSELLEFNPPVDRMDSGSEQSDSSDDESYERHRLDSRLRISVESDESDDASGPLHSSLDHNPRTRNTVEFPDATAAYEVLLRLAETLGDVPRGLDIDAINQLPCRRECPSNPAPKADRESKCLICLCEWKKDDHIRTLPCFHEFHSECIDEWLKIIFPARHRCIVKAFGKVSHRKLLAKLHSYGIHDKQFLPCMSIRSKCLTAQKWPTRDRPRKKNQRSRLQFFHDLLYHSRLKKYMHKIAKNFIYYYTIYLSDNLELRER